MPSIMKVADERKEVSRMNLNREELMKLEKGEIIDILFALIQQQAQKIAELEARLNQNSKNSSKPPSSDGFNKPKPKSLRKPSGKKPGSQQGHKGHGLKLMSPPDRYAVYLPEACVHCPMATTCLGPKTVSETRYEIDINISTVTTAHQVMRVTCPLACPQPEDTLTGSFPDGINSTMQYGANLEALAIALNTVGMVSLSRTHEILSGVFGIPISTGTIAAMVSDCAAKVTGTVQEIKEAVIHEPLVHVDETGLRVDKKTHWAHTASTADLTCIEVQQGRGKADIEKFGILPAFRGTAIHDCLASYFSFKAIRHGLCNAHLLRELVAVLENAKQAWAQELIDLLLTMKGVKERFIEKGRAKPTRYYLKKFRLAYDQILAAALALNPVPERAKAQKGRLKRGKTGALVDRLLCHKEKYLLFFADFSVPFDNNLAERSIRMLKVKQKVSGCFRTLDGATNFAAIMSFMGTARKRGIFAFQAIKDALMGNPFSVKVNSPAAEMDIGGV